MQFFSKYSRPSPIVLALNNGRYQVSFYEPIKHCNNKRLQTPVSLYCCTIAGIFPARRPLRVLYRRPPRVLYLCRRLLSIQGRGESFMWAISDRPQWKRLVEEAFCKRIIGKGWRQKAMGKQKKMEWRHSWSSLYSSIFWKEELGHCHNKLNFTKCNKTGKISFIHETRTSSTTSGFQPTIR